MKVSPEHLSFTKAQIVAAAATLFKKSGYGGVSVASVMNQVGLTHGGFYRYFSSKEDLQAQASRFVLRRALKAWTKRAGAASGLRTDQPTQGRPSGNRRSLIEDAFVALACDTARESHHAKATFAAGLEDLVREMTNHQPGSATEEGRAVAIEELATRVGAVVLQRAAGAGALSAEIGQVKSVESLSRRRTLESQEARRSSGPRVKAAGHGQAGTE